MVGEHQMALGGIGVIIVAQITRKIVTSIAEKISQRVAGKIVGRLLGKAGSTVIPIAGWLIGTGMIAYDLWTSREGALPQIRTSLKSPEIAAGVRSEIAGSIRPELEAEIPGLARTIANDLFVEWRNTKRNIRQVLDLAAANPQFADILGSMASSEQVARLVGLVGMVQANGGEAALQAAIADGTLAAVANLPASAAPLAAENKSLQSALDWYNAVGARLDDVVELELYKGRTPESVDLAQLDKLLALGDKTAVARLSLLQGPQLDALLALPKENLIPLANQLAPDDLAWLGDQLPAMTQEQANDLVRRILSQPGVVPSLRQLGDLHQVVASRSLDSAITFVAGPKGTADFWTDVVTVLAGSVAPGLFVAKHGLWPSLGAVALMVLLALVVLRFLFGLGQWLVEPLGYCAVGSGTRSAAWSLFGECAELVHRATNRLRKDADCFGLSPQRPDRVGGAVDGCQRVGRKCGQGYSREYPQPGRRADGPLRGAGGPGRQRRAGRARRKSQGLRL